MTIKQTLQALILTLAVFATPFTVAREWTATSGHKIEGDFVKLDNGTVSIKLPDGKIANVPLDKLSDSDKEFITQENENGTAAAQTPADAVPAELILKGHGHVRSLALSPDGKLLASGGSDETVRIWDTATGSELRKLEMGANSPGDFVSFSFDGNLFLAGTAGYRSYVTIFDTATFTEKYTINCAGENEDGIRRFADASFSHDSQLIVISGDATYEIHNEGFEIYKAESGEKILHVSNRIYPSPVFSPNSKLLATIGQDGRIRLYNVQTGNEVAVLQAQGVARPEWSKICFSPDGKSLAVIHEKDVFIWDIAQDKELSRIKTGYEVLSSVFFLPDGQNVITIQKDSSTPVSLFVWDIKTSKVVQVIASKMGDKVDSATRTAMSYDGKLVAVSNNNKFLILNLEKAATGNEEQEEIMLIGHTGTIGNAVFSPDGKLVATAGSDGTARLWDAKYGKEVMQFESKPVRGEYGDGSGNVSFSPDGQYLAISNGDDSLLLCHIASGSKKEYSGGGLSLLISPDNKFIFSAHVDESITCVSVESGRNVNVARGGKTLHLFYVGENLAYVDMSLNSRERKIVNLMTRQPILVLEEPFRNRVPHPKDKAVVTDDFKSVLTYIYRDDEARLWNINGKSTGRELLRFPGWDDVTLSPDGKTIATANRDEIVLWDTSNGKRITEWEERYLRGAYSNTLQFSPDSKRLLYALDKVVKIRNISGVAEAGKNKQDELRGLLE